MYIFIIQGADYSEHYLNATKNPVIQEGSCNNLPEQRGKYHTPEILICIQYTKLAIHNQKKRDGHQKPSLSLCQIEIIY